LQAVLAGNDEPVARIALSGVLISRQLLRVDADAVAPTNSRDVAFVVKDIKYIKV
jgi:hypothetical protein